MATANHWPKLPAFPYLHIAKDRIYKTGFALQKDALAALINNTVIGTVMIMIMIIVRMECMKYLSSLTHPLNH